jgi:hypothetical protein
VTHLISCSHILTCPPGQPTRGWRNWPDDNGSNDRVKSGRRKTRYSCSRTYRTKIRTVGHGCMYILGVHYPCSRSASSRCSESARGHFPDCSRRACRGAVEWCLEALLLFFLKINNLYTYLASVPKHLKVPAITELKIG